MVSGMPSSRPTSSKGKNLRSAHSSARRDTKAGLVNTALIPLGKTSEPYKGLKGSDVENVLHLWARMEKDGVGTFLFHTLYENKPLSRNCIPEFKNQDLKAVLSSLQFKAHVELFMATVTGIILRAGDKAVFLEMCRMAARRFSTSFACKDDLTEFATYAMTFMMKNYGSRINTTLSTQLEIVLSNIFSIMASP